MPVTSLREHVGDQGTIAFLHFSFYRYHDHTVSRREATCVSAYVGFVQELALQTGSSRPNSATTEGHDIHYCCRITPRRHVMTIYTTPHHTIPQHCKRSGNTCLSCFTCCKQSSHPSPYASLHPSLHRSFQAYVIYVCLEDFISQTSSTPTMLLCDPPKSVRCTSYHRRYFEIQWNGSSVGRDKEVRTRR